MWISLSLISKHSSLCNISKHWRWTAHINWVIAENPKISAVFTHANDPCGSPEILTVHSMVLSAKSVYLESCKISINVMGSSEDISDWVNVYRHTHTHTDNDIMHGSISP